MSVDAGQLIGTAFEGVIRRQRGEGGLKCSTAWGWSRRSISVGAGARNHLRANRSLEFRFALTVW